MNFSCQKFLSDSKVSEVENTPHSFWCVEKAAERGSPSCVVQVTRM